MERIKKKEIPNNDIGGLFWKFPLKDSGLNGENILEISLKDRGLFGEFTLEIPVALSHKQ